MKLRTAEKRINNTSAGCLLKKCLYNSISLRETVSDPQKQRKHLHIPHHLQNLILETENKIKADIGLKKREKLPDLTSKSIPKITESELDLFAGILDIPHDVHKMLQEFAQNTRNRYELDKKDNK